MQIARGLLERDFSIANCSAEIEHVILPESLCKIGHDTGKLVCFTV